MKTERTATTTATRTESELAELMVFGGEVLFDGVDELPMLPLIGVAEDEVLVAGGLLGVVPLIEGALLGVVPLMLAGDLPVGAEDKRTGHVFLTKPPAGFGTQMPDGMLAALQPVVQLAELHIPPVKVPLALQTPNA